MGTLAANGSSSMTAGNAEKEHFMKIGIIGTGDVGCACAMAAVTRASARTIILVNRTRKTARAAATDLRYGIPLGRKVEILDGDYDALRVLALC
jgi:L-lactate dehydrogenase